jgi:hypothetical protein
MPASPTTPGSRAYECVASLCVGMVLMFFGFFAYLGGKSLILSVGIMSSGAAIECRGFFLAYLAYKDSVRASSNHPN